MSATGCRFLVLRLPHANAKLWTVLYHGPLDRAYAAYDRAERAMRRGAVCMLNDDGDTIRCHWAIPVR
jgi:hypothetical protein